MELKKSCLECTCIIDCCNVYQSGTLILCKLTSTTCKETKRINKCVPVKSDSVYCTMHEMYLQSSFAVACKTYSPDPGQSITPNEVRKCAGLGPNNECLEIVKRGGSKGVKCGHTQENEEKCEIFKENNEIREKKKTAAINAKYLFMRRECENIDENLDCKIAPNKAWCNYSELNETECGAFMQKKFKDLKFKINKDGTFTITENGVESSYEGIFTCSVCNSLLPRKAEKKCLEKCPWPHEAGKFECPGGICHYDGKHFSITKQHPAGYLFCIHACPKSRNYEFSEPKIVKEKEKKPGITKKKPKKKEDDHQASLF